jgi:hypothetical protein
LCYYNADHQCGSHVSKGKERAFTTAYREW